MSVAARTVRALRHPPNWIQLAKFGVVGASGFVVNLVIYKLLLGIGAHGAAAVSFVVSAAWNYWWNRHWTFSAQKGSMALQGFRFYVVSAVAFGVNQLWLTLFLDVLHWGKLVAQAAAIILVTPLNFLGNKLWSFRTHQAGARSRPAEPGSAPASRP
jgi:putative flippase GtrA